MNNRTSRRIAGGISHGTSASEGSVVGDEVLVTEGFFGKKCVEDFVNTGGVSGLVGGRG